MRLIVTGYAAETVRYRFLWGMYVTGFRRWLHCQRCLRGTREKRIFAGMADDVILLDHPTEYFYLCGFAPGPGWERGQKNLHLAVRPKAGARAEARSMYGPMFVIEDAEEIAIRGPVMGEGLAEEHARCKNFRFGWQVYAGPMEGIGPGVCQDADACWDKPSLPDYDKIVPRGVR